MHGSGMLLSKYLWSSLDVESSPRLQTAFPHITQASGKSTNPFHKQPCRLSQSQRRNKKTQNVRSPLCFPRHSSHNYCLAAPSVSLLPGSADNTSSVHTAKPEDNQLPKTVYERSAQVYLQGHPYASSLASGGHSGLSPADRTLWANAHFARTPALLKRLGNKAQKDVWKCVNEAGGLPLRAVKPPSPTNGSGASSIQGGISGGRSAQFGWGRDRFGADLGDYTPGQFSQRKERALQLAALEVQRTAFSDKREREREKWVDPKTKELVAVTPDEIEEEKLRRKEIARLRMELYGERTGAYASNPTWDDVIPIPVEDGEGALAAIAYPEDYAEGLFIRTCLFG